MCVCVCAYVCVFHLRIQIAPDWVHVCPQLGAQSDTAKKSPKNLLLEIILTGILMWSQDPTIFYSNFSVIVQKIHDLTRTILEFLLGERVLAKIEIL